VKCGIRNRLLSDGAKELNKFKYLFDEVKDQYGNKHKGGFVNL